MPAWLKIHEGTGPVIVSFPHTWTQFAGDLEGRLVSSWQARKDTDWWVDQLYGFVKDQVATMIGTLISRTVIDVNRDPSGASLYPGQATTELCPTTTFDGEPLYKSGCEPSPAEIAARHQQFFDPYHAALAGQIARLRAKHPSVVLYDAHSIRSRIPRLFGGLLPHFNLGTHSGASCGPALVREIEKCCDHPGFDRVTNGRFKGGWTTRHYGDPQGDVHAVQMELACRAYLREPEGPLTPERWPPEYDSEFASPARALLCEVLAACESFARAPSGRSG